jgi:cyclophilin family peptidyl-prolyl cis-trans isomerase
MQCFIIPSRDGFGSTVFGQVIDGTQTIENMEFAKLQMMNGISDVPIKPVVIESVKVIK